MAATPIIQHTEFTVENLPPGFRYIPESKQIYCEKTRKYSFLNPDNSVKCFGNTYESVNAFVFMHQYVFEQQEMKKAEEKNLSNDNLIKFKLCTNTKIKTTKADLICIISWIVLLVIISAITPLFIQMQLNGV